MNPETTQNNSQAPQTTPTKKSYKKTLVIIVVIVLIIGAAICAVFFYRKASVSPQDPNKVTDAQAMALIAKVDKIIDLPKGETPVLVVISDLSKLAGNPFFVKAKIGDDVLIYTLAKKAFIYDPKANIIVDATTLNLSK